MTQPLYALMCPRCGGPLQPVALDAQSAPWLCGLCRLGFFASELSSTARAAYRPLHRDFGLGPMRRVLSGLVAQERAGAESRGTSLREDQLHLVPVRTLTMLRARDAAFAQRVQHVIAQRGG